MMQKISVLTLLGICSYEDAKHKHIHIAWPAIFAALGTLLCFMEGEQRIIRILPAVLPGLFVLLLTFVTKGGIGEGDGILLMTMGIFLGGTDVLRIFTYALFFAGSYALFLFFFKKKSRKYEIAFVPFLLLAFIGELLLL